MHDAPLEPADQLLFSLDAEHFRQFAAMLNAPPAANAGLQRLMAVHPPWDSSPPDRPWPDSD